MKMTQKIIGTFEMGYLSIELVLREGTGGDCYLIPEKGKIPRIKIGADHDKWQCVVTALIHEALELYLAHRHLRYLASEDLSNDHSAYQFLFDHPQFSDACSCLSEFLCAALPTLATAWKSWGKEKAK